MISTHFDYRNEARTLLVPVVFVVFAAFSVEHFQCFFLAIFVDAPGIGESVLNRLVQRL